ncbi:lysostaphin resistance A-like protein [Caldimonas sp. KR1-144]|uniref:CPBP family intramembrane glutamic endopeptidase n=1 Tax=Caldimonas sp. KR1-144 TaxID=3400911 RepID=UPI003C00AE02
MELVLTLTLLIVGQVVLMGTLGPGTLAATAVMVVAQLWQLGAVRCFWHQVPQRARESITAWRWRRELLWASIACVLASAVTLGLRQLLPEDADGMRWVRSILAHPLGWVGIAVLAPLVEEVVFRALIFEAWPQAWPRWVPALLTSGLFALAHLNAITAPLLFALALAWQSAYVRTRSIVPGLVGHMALNAASCLALAAAA